MVNTFLVVRDFRQSATYLSRAHLGKQRVEAMQIRNILRDLDFLSWYFEVPPPPRGAKKEELYEWSREVNQLYRELPYRFIISHQGEVTAVPKGFTFYKPKDNEIYQVDGDYVTLSTKTGRNPRQIPIDEFLFPGEHEIGVGMRNHPVLGLWYTYLPALEEYINAHIDEWVSRGYNNTMLYYDLPTTIEYPSWLDNPEFYRSMRARLREKEYEWLDEYERGERKTRVEVWYTCRDFFLEAGEDTGYLW